MEIEAKQVISQIIAFLLMLWILKKLAWKPLLGLMEERRHIIEEQFESIEAEKRKISELHADYDKKLSTIDNEAKSRLQEAVSEGRKIAEDIQRTAREQSKELLAKTKEQIQREIAQAKMQLKNDVVELTMAVTHKVLDGNINTDQQRALVTDFVNHAELE